jgi:hypothetical protein
MPREIRGKLNAMRSVPVLLALVLASGCGGNEPEPRGCAVDAECPLHQLCGDQRVCVSGCLSDDACPGQTCTAHGRCGDGDDAGMMSELDAALEPPDLSTPPPPPDLAGTDLLAVCSGACADAAKEPNDKANQATMIASTVALTDVALCSGDNADWYKVSAAQAGTLEVELVNGPCGVPLRIDLFGSDGASPVGMSAITSTGWHATGKVTAGQVRYIRVEAALNPGQNPYTLTVTNPPTTT